MPDPFRYRWAGHEAQALAALEAVERGLAAQGVVAVLFWGTLLGALRHGDLIPWDDDADMLAVGPFDLRKLRARLERRGYVIARKADYFKVWRSGSEAGRSVSWGWPFVDLFVGWRKGADLIVRWQGERQVLPSRLVLPIGAARLRGRVFQVPGEAEELLDRDFPGWREEAVSPYWDHREERGITPHSVRAPLAEALSRSLATR